MSHHQIKRRSGNYSLRENWRIFWPVLAVFAVPLLLTAFVIVKTSWPYHAHKVPAGQNLRLIAAKLHPNQLHLFETSISGQKVRFVVERTQDNTIHVALAACRFCYRERHSNQVRDGAVFCDRCRGSMDFAAAKTVERANSCDLVEVQHQQSGRNVTIQARDITQIIAELAQK